MHSLSLIAVAVLGTLYGIAWHNQPAREPERRAIEPRALVPHLNKSSHLNWEILAISSLVVISFTALFLAAYGIWAKCHG